ncbi:ComEC/Rec2 family competence protein [Verrucomicrobiota bacterium]
MAICYILGTWVGLRSGVEDAWLIGVLGAALIAAVVSLLVVPPPGGEEPFSRMPSRTGGLVLLSVFAAAAVAARLSPSFRGTVGLGRRLGPDGRHAVAIGMVAGATDEAAEPGPSGRRTAGFPLRLHALRLDREGWERTAGRIHVSWHGRQRLKRPEYGEVWLLEGRLSSLGGPAGSGRFFMHVYSSDSRMLQASSGGGLLAACFRARDTAARVLTLGIEDYPREYGLVQAMLLGCRSRLARQERDVFVATGTLHIFAVSGLHVGIVCGLIVFVLKAFKVSRVRWVLFLGPLLIAYAAATGARPSAVRACLMALIYFAAPLLGRRPDVVSALAVSAVLLLAWDPGQLTNLGFVFSFVVSGGLIAAYPVLFELTRPLWAPDPLRLQPEPSAIRGLRAAGMYVAGLAALSLSAWAASTPLTAYFFGRFTPMALLGNLLVIPLAFLIVVSGSLALVSGFCVGILAEVFNHATLALVFLLVRLVRALSAVPCASVEVGEVPLWAVSLWYGALAACLFRLHPSDERRLASPACPLMAQEEPPANSTASGTRDSAGLKTARGRAIPNA